MKRTVFPSSNVRKFASNSTQPSACMVNPMLTEVAGTYGEESANYQQVGIDKAESKPANVLSSRSNEASSSALGEVKGFPETPLKSEIMALGDSTYPIFSFQGIKSTAGLVEGKNTVTYVIRCAEFFPSWLIGGGGLYAAVSRFC